MVSAERLWQELDVAHAREPELRWALKVAERDLRACIPPPMIDVLSRALAPGHRLRLPASVWSDKASTTAPPQTAALIHAVYGDDPLWGKLPRNAHATAGGVLLRSQAPVIALPQLPYHAAALTAFAGPLVADLGAFWEPFRRMVERQIAVTAAWDAWNDLLATVVDILHVSEYESSAFEDRMHDGWPGKDFERLRDVQYAASCLLERMHVQTPR